MSAPLSCPHCRLARLFFLTLLIGTLFCTRVTRAAESIAPGKGSFEFAPTSDATAKKLTVWTFRPDDYKATSPIVIVMHGVKRNGETYRDNWIAHSRKHGFLLLVPEFPEADYPGEAYQQGNLVDRNGQANPPERWTFTIIEKLFDHARQLSGSTVDRYLLYGHSAGGQFVHRFVMFMPNARYARAVAANPGYYTFPTADANFPYGLKQLPPAIAFRPEVLSRDVVVLLGEADTDRNDPNLRRTPEADAQGKVRFERGKAFYVAAAQVAEASRVKFAWKLVTVPEVGHSDPKMSESAVIQLLK